jgi:hypothetical protein
MSDKAHESFDTIKLVIENKDHLSVEFFELMGVRELPGLVIERVVREEVTSPTGKKSQMGVVYFTGKKIGLALNATNIRRIIEISGSRMSDDWIGTTITLQLENGKLFGGGRGDTIRVKPKPFEKAHKA